MKTTINCELSTAQKAFVRKLVQDPVLFARHILGVELWEREVEILRSIKDHRRTAMKACHSVGKTFTLAVAALWWLARYKEGIVLTTSPTQRQVRTQLWSEIHRLVERAKVPYPPLKTTELKFRDDSNFAIGFSTNQAENFQGYHGKFVLIIADEAPGIESGIWDAIAGTMAGGKVHIVMAGNPTISSGAFFDAFTRERNLWNCITVDAFDSPNLRGLSLEQLLRMDPVDRGPLDDNPFPYLVTRRWVADQYAQWWHGDERSSPRWMSRVRAEFPGQAKNALIKLAWLERAKERALANPVEDTGGPLVAGVDVGGGEAETVVYLCQSTRRVQKIIKLGAWRADDTRGEVVRFLEPYRSRLSAVRVDSVGIGYNFGLHLKDLGFPVEPINVGLPCPSQPELHANDPALRFANEKARRYQNLADAFERNQVEGLVDDQTIAQLAGIVYELDSRGRTRIESKENARQRGLSSLDRAEALMLAIGAGFERHLLPHMLQDLAGIYAREGKDLREIADRLEADEEEVKAWIKRDAESRVRLGLSPGEYICARADCDRGVIIRHGTKSTYTLGRFYHPECALAVVYGSSNK
jgi:phage terminase large subunit